MSRPDGALCGAKQHYLDSAGRWGVMEEGRWKAFLEWLDESGLLTDKVRRSVPEGLRCEVEFLGGIGFKP